LKFGGRPVHELILNIFLCKPDGDFNIIYLYLFYSCLYSYNLIDKLTVKLIVSSRNHGKNFRYFVQQLRRKNVEVSLHGVRAPPHEHLLCYFISLVAKIRPAERGPLGNLDLILVTHYGLHAVIEIKHAKSEGQAELEVALDKLATKALKLLKK
jgi:hypothetical protein